MRKSSTNSCRPTSMGIGLRRALQIRHGHRLGRSRDRAAAAATRSGSSMPKGRLGFGPVALLANMRNMAPFDTSFPARMSSSRPGQAGFRIGLAVAVVDDEERAIGRLEAVGIRHALPLVEHQAAPPRLAVVVGEKRRQVRPLRRPLLDLPVLHEEQPPRSQPADVEPCVGVLCRDASAATRASLAVEKLSARRWSGPASTGGRRAARHHVLVEVARE